MIIMEGIQVSGLHPKQCPLPGAHLLLVVAQASELTEHLVNLVSELTGINWEGC
jgi:hypothetical protein